MTAPFEPGSQGPGLTSAELQSRAISGSLWTAIHAVVSVPVAFVANAVVARILGPASYGELALLTFTLAIAVQVTNLGFSDGVIQWGAAAESRGERTKADELLRRSAGFHMVVQLPLLVIAVLLLAGDEALWIQLTLLVSVSVPAAVGASALAITIENKTAAAARLVILTGFLVQLAVVSAAALGESAPAVWAARSIAASLLLPLNFLLLDRIRRRVVLQPRLPRRLPRGFWRYALQTSAAALIGTLVFTRSEIFLLEAFASRQEVGLFALAFGIATQVTAPIEALLAPLMPAIAGLLSTAEDLAERAIGRAQRFAAFIAGIVLAGVLPPLYFLVPAIYGADFETAAPLLLVLAAVTCLKSAFNPVYAFTHARRKSSLLLRANSLALLVSAALGIPAIIAYGAWGGVLSSAVGYVVTVSLVVRSEAMEHRGGLRRMVADCRSWAIGLVALALAVGAGSALPGSPAVAASTGVSVGLLSYLVGVRVLGASLGESDWAALRRSVPKRLHFLIHFAIGVAGRRPDPEGQPDQAARDSAA